MKNYYYLITDLTREGDHEYTDYIPVRSKKPVSEWDDSWCTLFLFWQYCINWIDGDDLWSDNRIVRVDAIKEITKDEYETIGRLTDCCTVWEQIAGDGAENLKEFKENE